MTVDTSHRKYSTVHIQFHPTGILFRLGRRLDKIGKKSKAIKSVRRWLRKKKGSRVVEHKIKIPVEVCNTVSKARSFFNTSSLCTDDSGCHLFINESWSGLNPYNCMPGTPKTSAGSCFDEDAEDAASSFCFNPVSKLSFEVMEEINALRNSLSTKDNLGTEVVAKRSTKASF